MGALLGLIWPTCFMNRVIGGELFCPNPSVPGGNGFCATCGPLTARDPMPHVSKASPTRVKLRRLVRRLGGPA